MSCGVLGGRSHCLLGWRLPGRARLSTGTGSPQMSGRGPFEHRFWETHLVLGEVARPEEPTLPGRTPFLAWHWGSCPSRRGPGGMGSPQSGGTLPLPSPPSSLSAPGQNPQRTNRVLGGQAGTQDGRPQPSHPARTLAADLPVPLTCPAGWCEPSAWETVVTWQPSPSNCLPATSTQGPEESRRIGRGRGQMPRGSWAPHSLQDHP